MIRDSSKWNEVDKASQKKVFFETNRQIEKTCSLLEDPEEAWNGQKRPALNALVAAPADLVGTHEHTWGQDMSLFEHLMAEQGVGLDVFSHGDYIAGTGSMEPKVLSAKS
jgi:hypothetical protein